VQKVGSFAFLMITIMVLLSVCHEAGFKTASSIKAMALRGWDARGERSKKRCNAKSDRSHRTGRIGKGMRSSDARVMSGNERVCMKGILLNLEYAGASS